MGQQFGPDTRVGKILDLAPASPELKSRMAGQFVSSLAGTSKSMSPEEQNRNLNLAKSWASQPTDANTEEDIEKQQQSQRATGYVS